MLKMLLMAGFGILACATLAVAEPVGNQPYRPATEHSDTDRAHLHRQITTLQQRLGGITSAVAARAWDDVVAHWQTLQTTTAAGRQQAAQQLVLALKKLEQAWQAQQHAEDEQRPFFYAIDMATRMTA